MAFDTRELARSADAALRALIGVDREGVETFLTQHEDTLPSLVKREVRSKLKTGKKTPNR